MRSSTLTVLWVLLVILVSPQLRAQEAAVPEGDTPPDGIRIKVEGAFKQGLKYWQGGDLRRAIEEFSEAYRLFDRNTGYKVRTYGRWGFVPYYPSLFLALARCEKETMEKDRVSAWKRQCTCDAPFVEKAAKEITPALQRLAERCADGRLSEACAIDYIEQTLRCRNICQRLVAKAAPAAPGS